MDAPNVKPRPPLGVGLGALAAGAGSLLLAAVVVGVPLAMLRTGMAGEPPQPDQVIDGFLATCGEGDWRDEQQRKRVLDIVATLRKDPASADAVITEALREARPDFAAALDALSERDTGGAVSRLGTLAEAKNPYLAAESSFFLARAHVLDEDYEKALPLLDDVVNKHSVHSLRVAEALFLRGLCESRMLKRVEAIASFAELIERYPNAPQRTLAAARQNLELLERLELGSLGDIHDQIEYSRRRLSLEDSGTKTQEVQDDVVAMLTSLIEEIEKQGGT